MNSDLMMALGVVVAPVVIFVFFALFGRRLFGMQTWAEARAEARAVQEQRQREERALRDAPRAEREPRDNDVADAIFSLLGWGITIAVGYWIGTTLEQSGPMTVLIVVVAIGFYYVVKAIERNKGAH